VNLKDVDLTDYVDNEYITIETDTSDADVTSSTVVPDEA
jgi:hypothetical protein